MPFFSFPGPSVAVCRMVDAKAIVASFTNQLPVLRFIELAAKQRGCNGVTAIAGFQSFSGQRSISHICYARRCQPNLLLQTSNREHNRSRSAR